MGFSPKCLGLKPKEIFLIPSHEINLVAIGGSLFHRPVRHFRGGRREAHACSPKRSEGEEEEIKIVEGATSKG